jgi:Zn finger protein HypA/HybF involved in hydrogenase expression
MNMDRLEESVEVLEEAVGILSEKKGSESTEMYCNECGKKFKKKITSKTVEVKCPKCGGYDTEPSEYFGH